LADAQRESAWTSSVNHCLQRVGVLLTMISIVPSTSPLLYPRQAKLLTELGERVRAARLRRRFTASLVAERADISRQTLTKVERGDPSVTLGTYLRVLVVVGLEGDIALIAANDPVGRRLQDSGLEMPKRVRRPPPAAPPERG
jgi:DNA-binding XRE family transcriptional regulator